MQTTRLLYAIAIVGLVVFAGGKAFAQQDVSICLKTVTPNGGLQCYPVSSSNPLPTTGGGGGGSGPLHSAPTAFSATLTTTPTLILAAGTPTRISFIAQGSGYCAYSFTSTTPSVNTSGVSTNGYPLSNGSAFNSSSSAVPTTPLYGVCAAGSSMTIYGDYQ